MLIVSPAIVTSLLAAHLGAVWIALLCLGCLGTVAIAARLRVTLTAEQDLVMQPPVAESPLERLGDLPTVALDSTLGPRLITNERADTSAGQGAGVRTDSFGGP
jgi:hypothetical protein